VLPHRPKRWRLASLGCNLRLPVREHEICMLIAIVAFKDCMTSAVYGLLDAFNIASRLAPFIGSSRWGDHHVLLVAHGDRSVKGCGGFRIDATGSIADSVGSDVVIVPPIMRDLEGVLERERGLVEWLSGFQPGRTLLASVCTGAFLLAEAGHLTGRRVTTNLNFRDLFSARYPSVHLTIDERLVEDRGVICAGSTTAFLDLALHIVDRLGGHELAVSTAKALSMDKNPSSQRPYLLFLAPRDHGDERVLRLQDWIAVNHASRIEVSDMAQAGGMSSRNLARRFREATGLTPVEYLRMVRLETAKRLLESDAAPLDRVAERVGYGDTRAFIRAFGAAVGLSPGAYRRRFGVLAPNGTRN
jgi:transcriptional regulator GlxA family with amidase domain